MQTSDPDPAPLPEVRPPRRVEVAPIWRRGLAFGVDAIAVATIAVVLTVALVDFPESRWNTLDRLLDLINEHTLTALTPIFICGLMAIAWHTGFHFLWGCSPGKRLMRLEILDRTGRRPSFGRVLAHASLRLASVGLLFGGNLWALVDPERRTLHDRVADLYVVGASRGKP